MSSSIRPWRMEDAADLAEAINNQAILDNLRDGIPHPYTLADAEFFIGSMLEAPAHSQYTWAIDVDGRAVGSIGVFRKENIHFRTAEMGYWLAQAHWGKGIGTRAVQDACAWIFENTDILRVFAEPFAHNAASCRILEKAGFAYEGTLRRNAVKNGEVLDMKVYAALRPEQR